jgi:hypothetical protein
VWQDQSVLQLLDSTAAVGKALGMAAYLLLIGSAATSTRHEAKERLLRAGWLAGACVRNCLRAALRRGGEGVC